MLMELVVGSWGQTSIPLSGLAGMLTFVLLATARPREQIHAE